MANQLDLQEQEQLDELKAFWKQWGNLITWVITACLLAYAGWNAWGWYQRDQAVKASAMFDELDKAAVAGDADKVGRVFGDLKERYAGAALTEQAGLIAARVQYDKGQADAAKASLGWVAEKADEEEYRRYHDQVIGFLRGEHAADYLWPHLKGARAAEMMNTILERFDE